MPPRPRPRPHPGRRRGRFRHRFFVPLPVFFAPPPVFVQPIGCPVPLVDGGTRLVVTGRWATACFMPAYHRARVRWGNNAPAIASEIMFQLVPQASLGPPRTAAEQELRRRIDLAVAILLNAEGVVVPYPPSPPTPRPRAIERRAPWLRALLTGWP